MIDKVAEKHGIKSDEIEEMLEIEQVEERKDSDETMDEELKIELDDIKE